MSFFAKRKRKNDDPPRFPAWVLVLIAIGLVIIIELIFQPASTTTSSLVVNQPQYDFYTATPCMRLETFQPDITAANNDFDPLELTATAIVGIATSEAQGTRQPCL